MKAALITGFIGLALCFALGISKFNLTFLDVCWYAFSSNLAVLVSLLLYLQTDRLPSSIKKWISGSWKAWSLIALFYFGILLNLAPSLRNWEILSYLFFPLVLSTGFAVLAFGPIRDRIVWHYQRKACTEASRPPTETKDDFPCFPSDSAVL